MATDLAPFPGGPPARSSSVSWAEFMELTSVHPTRVGELLDLGWIDPNKTPAGDLLFQMRDVYRVRKLERLILDFELSTLAGTIIIDLLERVETLERQVRRYERLTRMP